jgi:2-polyprenyl-6-methoxyphenol hydroxylase-like FAD-dependent oxidoreductase
MVDKVKKLPVVIVGGGPVGLALGLELGLHETHSVIIEQRDGKVNFPKMNSVSTRAMEFCRRWGVASKIRRASIGENHPLDVRTVTSVTGYELVRFKYPSYSERGKLDYTPEGNAVCSQLWFDPILLERARSIPWVTVRLRTRLDSFVQNEAGVIAEVTDLESQRKETIAAAYLIGCDGADSTVRELAGISLQGDPRLNTNLNVFFRCDSMLSFLGERPAQICRIIGPEGLWGMIHALDGRGLWRMTVNLPDGADPNSIDVTHIVRRAMGSDLEFEILAAYPWERRKVIAEHYRKDRIFLAGDSAHQMSTTGGFGMNTGIGDSVDLAWKIAAVHQGWGGLHLLGTYEIERKPIALRSVEEATSMFRKNRAMVPGSEVIYENSPEGERLRQLIAEAILTSDGRKQFETEGFQLGYRYDRSPIILPDGTSPPPDEISRYIQTARPGSRAPHAWLDKSRSTLDLFGRGFVLMCFGKSQNDVEGLVREASRRGMPLRVVHIDDQSIASLYERNIVLVRPDGHVAWRAASRMGINQQDSSTVE